jgi:hypothetical protein
MTAKEQPTSSGESGQAMEASGPESVGPWGTTRGIDQDPPWGLAEDSPKDEGSEPTAVSEGRRGERRAAPDGAAAGRDGLGTVEPTRFREAGPGGAPDTPARHAFPDDDGTDDLPDNSLERQTGMRPEGVSRRGDPEAPA